MKVLVTGGRDYKEYGFVSSELSKLKPTTIIHGGATGADRLAGIWADVEKIPTVVYRADWEKHGKSAGPIRNKEMLDKEHPDLVLAFPGGKGTANMVKIAKSAGITVIEPARPSEQLMIGASLP